MLTVNHDYWDQLSTVLTTYGLRQSEYDPCLFFGPDKGKVDPEKPHLEGFRYLHVMVDDFATFHENTATAHTNYDAFIAHVHESFPIGSSGELQWYLGMRISDMEDGSIMVSHARHVGRFLKAHGLGQCTPPSAPYEHGMMKSIIARGRHSLESSDHKVDSTMYRAYLQEMAYIGEISHPEIQATVSILQQFCIEPRESHLRAVSHCAKYLRGVFKKTLVYPPIKPQLEASVDSDWAADTETRFSRKGHETRANGVAIISTKSSLSRCIALSATEAEYIAVCDLVCDLIYFSGLFKDFGYPQEKIMVDEDNTGVLSYSRD